MSQIQGTFSQIVSKIDDNMTETTLSVNSLCGVDFNIWIRL